MSYWEQYRIWQIDPAASFAEAHRRIAACAESGGDNLAFGDLTLDRLPDEIGALARLRSLDCGGGGAIADYAPLASLAGLERLRIFCTDPDFTGLGFMAGWAQLRSLEITTPVDLAMAPAAGCRQLERLHIASRTPGLALHDFDALGDLPALTLLAFTHVAAPHLADLSRWTSLKSLSLTGCGLAALDGCERLRRLESLHLSDEPIHDLTPLDGLPRLESLNLAKMPLRDIASLARLPRLERILFAESLQVHDLRPLGALGDYQRGIGAGLQSLGVRDTPVADLAPLARLQRLESLSLGGTAVADIAPLRRLPALRGISLDSTQIRDLGSRGSLSHLRSLNVANTAVDSIAALAPAPALAGIDISNSQVADLEPLRAARHCRSLNLRGSQVADLRPLLETGSFESDHRDSAQTLDFRDTPAASASPELARLAALADQHGHSCFVETKRWLAEQAG